METSPISQSGGATGGGLIPVGGNSLGQDDFLQLLVTQLQQQDPLNPQDATEFTSQLAQFSSLEQLFNVNSGLQTLAAFQAAMANTQAATFIGREVTAVGNTITVKEGTNSGAGFNLSGQADSVTVQIHDAQGALVRTVDLGALDAGSHEFEWDGLTDDGLSAPDGTYEIRVTATAGGEEIATELLANGIVEGVEFDVDGTFLIVDGRRVALGDVVAVAAGSPA